MFNPTDFVAGALCLDFVNTMGGTRAGAARDHLQAYGDLLDWAVLAGALPKERATRLASLAEREAAKAQAQLAEAKAFREALHAVFAARLNRSGPPEEAVRLVNAKISEALAHARLKRNGPDYRWDWENIDALDAPLWAVARDAGDLLTAGPLDLIRECASETCGWLFLDATRNHSRRWCDMNSCGNRDKVRRYRRKADT